MEPNEVPQVPPKAQPANPLPATIRSTNTTSTAYIVDQLDRIKVEWAILERAQQNIVAEKEHITL